MRQVSTSFISKRASDLATLKSQRAISRRLEWPRGFVEGDASVDISPVVAPLARDIVVTKRRVSAFSGSDLDCVLRGLNVDSLVLVGVATSGAVLSTVRQAADFDYNMTVIGDLCLDLDPEVQRVLVDKVFPRQASVLSTEQWIRDVSNKKE